MSSDILYNNNNNTTMDWNTKLFFVEKNTKEKLCVWYCCDIYNQQQQAIWTLQCNKNSFHERRMRMKICLNWNILNNSKKMKWERKILSMVLSFHLSLLSSFARIFVIRIKQKIAIRCIILMCSHKLSIKIMDKILHSVLIFIFIFVLWTAS